MLKKIDQYLETLDTTDLKKMNVLLFKLIPPDRPNESLSRQKAPAQSEFYKSIDIKTSGAFYKNTSLLIDNNERF